MIQPGETLGARYVISTPPPLQAGALFEMVDRKGATAYGQLLAAAAVGPAVLAAVRQELAPIPALPTVLKPRELFTSAQGIPIAVVERPGLALLRDRAAELTESVGKREAAVWLLRQFASIAADLAQIHLVGATHGGISAGSIACNAQGPVNTCALAGFGVGAVARHIAGATPSKRGDLVDLLGALQEIFNTAGTTPGGGASAKWLLLRHSSMHGEHPALASGSALAAALNEMASLPEESDAPRGSRAPSRMATMTPPRFEGRASAPPGERRSVLPSTRASAPSRAPGSRTTNRPSAPVEPPPSRKPRVSIPIVVAGITLVTLVVGAGVYFGIKTREEVSLATTGTRPHARPTPAAATCEGESLRPMESAGITQSPNEYMAVCTPGTPRLVVAAREGTRVIVNARPATRGQHFAEAPTRVHDGAVELGSVLALDDATWVAWRNGVGSPLGLARIDANGSANVNIPLDGWDSVPLRGAHVLHATARTAWVVTNVSSEGGAHGVLLEINYAGGQNRPPVIAWYLGSGTVDAVVTGEAPTLLMRQRSVDGTGTRYDLTGVTLQLSAVASARKPSEVTSVRGANLPDNVITRTPPVTVRSDVVVVAPRGVLANGAASFLITAGQARPAENCPDPARCVSAGQVSRVSVTAGAAPTLTPVLPNAWGNDLLVAPGGGLRAAVTTANVAGVEMTFHTLLDVAAERPSAEGSRTEVATSRALRARFVGCGTEVWTVFDPPTTPPTLAALPASCLPQR